MSKSVSEVAVMETKLSNCRSRFGVLGASSLGISVFLGVSFTLIVASGVRYVTAQHAVEQALEATLRCLTNAGGPCVGSTPTFNTSLSDWYLERQGLMSTTWADRYQYEAYLGQQKWEATYSGFRIHQVQAPLVEATLWRVPVRKFVAAANDRRIVSGGRVLSWKDDNRS